MNFIGRRRGEETRKPSSQIGFPPIICVQGMETWEKMIFALERKTIFRFQSISRGFFFSVFFQYSALKVSQSEVCYKGSLPPPGKLFSPSFGVQKLAVQRNGFFGCTTRNLLRKTEEAEDISKSFQVSNELLIAGQSDRFIEFSWLHQHTFVLALRRLKEGLLPSPSLPRSTSWLSTPVLGPSHPSSSFFLVRTDLLPRGPIYPSLGCFERMPSLG